MSSHRTSVMNSKTYLTCTVMLLVILSLVTHYYVITYNHVIMGMNNEECHVLEKAVNISKRSVQIWPAIVPAGHYIGNEAGH